ncbi:hypothetical protein DL767_005028 [Monosporascus sp. MG133]|nr:hypothetical protein DL767_005028 [Monosporascus sp. MG133]
MFGSQQQHRPQEIHELFHVPDILPVAPELLKRVQQGRARCDAEAAGVAQAAPQDAVLEGLEHDELQGVNEDTGPELGVDASLEVRNRKQHHATPQPQRASEPAGTASQPARVDQRVDAVREQVLARQPGSEVKSPHRMRPANTSSMNSGFRRPSGATATADTASNIPSCRGLCLP